MTDRKRKRRRGRESGGEEGSAEVASGLERRQARTLATLIQIFSEQLPKMPRECITKRWGHGERKKREGAGKERESRE